MGVNREHHHRRANPEELRSRGGARLISSMAHQATVHVEVDLPADLARLALPEGVDRRLHVLLDKQDLGEPLTDDERVEAEGLVDLADLLTLLRLRATREGGPKTGP
jgi:hypothetical protein